jgi:hypothetical protein
MNYKLIIYSINGAKNVTIKRIYFYIAIGSFDLPSFGL